VVCFSSRRSIKYPCNNKINMTQEQIPQGILSNFSISTFYRFFIYLGSVILILSLFFDVKGYDVGLLRFKAMVVIVAGVLCWIINSLLWSYIGYLDLTEQYRRNNVEKEAADAIAAYWVGVFIVLFFSAILVFK